MDKFYKILKNLLNAKQEPVVENAGESIIQLSPEDLETFNERLKEFDNEAVIKKVIALENIVMYIAQKIEVQSEVIRRQSEILKDMNSSIEELVFVLDSSLPQPAAAASATKETQPTSTFSKKTDVN